MKWKIYDEYIEMVAQRFRFLPNIFRWQGHCYHVETIERIWTVARWRWGGRVERRFFQVRCSEGILELYQDLEAGTWHVRRARMAPLRTSAVRRVAIAWR
jgi:hypothetical protein